MKRRVFVLGAGFTKAFYPNAPLLEDTFDADSIESALIGLPHAKHVFELERRRGKTRNHLNIERLLTRLESGMPYDKGRKADQELGLLRTKVFSTLIDRIGKAKRAVHYGGQLHAFASYCLWEHIDIITYNYDDLLDEMLAQPLRLPRPESEARVRRWEPESGYGFRCTGLGQKTLMPERIPINPRSAILLLKLHGSMNWRVRLGASAPYDLASIVQLGDWLGELIALDGDPKDHLDPDPFIVPPVLSKGELTKEPILRYVWGRAYELLENVDEITFVGYSFPFTDIASIHLFSEALKYPKVEIKVVNYAEDSQSQDGIVNAYRRVFPALRHENFRFDGALKWADEQVRDLWESLKRQPSKPQKEGPIAGG